MNSQLWILEDLPSGLTALQWMSSYLYYINQGDNKPDDCWES
jgi:hypothetical protein